MVSGEKEASGGAGASVASDGATLGVPSLVINPSNATSTDESGKLHRTWSKQQCKIRRVALDRLRYWQSHGYEVLWVTLTSGVYFDNVKQVNGHKLLRRHFEELRKRVSRRWHIAPFEYVCVETAEGNGVLHMLWASKAEKGQFYVPYAWLSAEWQSIHGAWNVWVARVRSGDGDRRRLSRYIVSQYCGGQYAVVRVSQSRMEFAFAKARKALLGAMKGCTDRYLLFARIKNVGDQLGRLCNQWYWMEFRQAWDHLVKGGECEFFNVRHVWFLGKLEEL